MRTSKFLSIGAVILTLTLLLTACLGDDDPTPLPRRTLDVLDNAIAQQESMAAITREALLGQTQVYQQTLSAYQTAVAPPTQAPIIRRSPQPTPTPTDDPLNDFFGNIVYAGNWLAERFEATDGETYSFNSFEGKIVVLMPMSLDCVPCEEQLEYARETERQFKADGSPYEIVFLNLNVSPLDSLEELITWAEAEAFESTDSITWLTGKASSELVAALNREFGGSAINLQRTPIIIVDKRGQGHTAGSEGLLSPSRLRDAIVFYENPPTIENLDGVDTEATDEPALP